MDGTIGTERAAFGGTRAVVFAALWAIAGALAGRELGVIGAAAAGAAAVLWTLGRGRADPAVLALPAALGALSLPAPEPAWPPEGPVRLAGRVCGPLGRDVVAGTLRFHVEPERGGAPVLCVAPLRGRPRPDALLPGDRVEGLGFLREPGPRRAGDRPPLVEVELGALRIEPGGPTVQRLATLGRLRLEDALLAHLPDEAGRLCAHLVLGDGPRLPDDLVDAHRATGLAHLLAVSGAHATLLAWMLAAGFALARGRDPWQAKAFRRGCAVFLLAYGAVTGFEPPVVRALVAWLLVAAAAARGRRPHVAAALAVPALVTALLAPRDLLSVSFCLSYAAVVGLAAAGAFRRPEGLRDHLTQALRASLWAMLATSPLTLLYFGQVAPWTIVGTPLLAPVVALMLALGVLTAVLGVALPALADVTAVPLGFLAEGYAAAVRTLAELPLAPIHAPFAPSTWTIAGFALLGATALVLRPDRRGLALLCALTSLPFFVGPVPATPASLRLCAVGHGQAAVVRMPDGAAVVVDCGNLNDPARAARAAEAALGARRRVELLVVSHGDADHSGAVARLGRRVPIARAVLPDELRGGPVARALTARGAAVTFVARGETIRPRPDVTVHAPAVDPKAARNERSLWTVVEAGGDRVVLPGDAEAEGIRTALRDLLDFDAAVLVLPHHGRGPAESGARLLERLRPRACLVSTGEGAPAPLADLARSRGIPVLSTGEQGTLTLWLDGSRAVTAERPARIPLR